MSLNNLNKLFSVGFLALVMAGCSSTPTTDGSADATSNDMMDKAVVETSIAAPADAVEATDVDAAQTPLMDQVVKFDFDRSEVTSKYFSVISAHADFMLANSDAKVTVSGHCDERGTREYNLALGERRAIAVKNALIAKGVSADRINVVSFGEDSPVDMGHNSAAWSENRRAEFKY
ncbi:MAG: peptidoglycan-associated lipoprotein Pal [Pseudomonadota bacterium]|nr:peptidoglycan-associated lipoprotein Pal [Pseudomonadota bacterium]